MLIATSHVSLDELTTLSPKDESIHVTLESEQTKIGIFTPNAIIDEEAAERLREGDPEDPTKEVDPDFVHDGEGDSKQWPQYKPGGEEEIEEGDVDE